MNKYNYLLLIVFTVLFSSCGAEQTDKKEKEEEPDSMEIEVSHEQFTAMKMEVAELEEKEFDTTINVAGKVDVPPKDRVKITSFIAGYVKSIPLLVGSRVAKGQALLTLESPEYIDLQQSYMEIAGQMNYLLSEHERQKTLFEEKISSQKKYLEAESDYKRAKATYESLKQKLQVLHIDPKQVEKGLFSSHIVIYSPIAGDITSINVNAGMAISSSDVIMEIVDTQSMHLELAVFEKDVFSLGKGQKIRFNIPQVGDEQYEATITQIGKSVEGNDRVIKIYASLAEEVKQKMLVGMFVNGQLITDSRKAQSVPFDAVTISDENSYILTLISDTNDLYKFQKTMVTTGERNGDWIEITPNELLSPKTKVLFKGVYDLVM